MQPSNDRPLDIWSDDELVEQYRSLTGAGGQEGIGDDGRLENIREEMEKRGLSRDDLSTSLADSGGETDDDGAVIDPSSGASPPPG